MEPEEMIMKASRITVTLFIAGLFLISACITFCQTEKLDIIEYTPPKGWTKTPKDGVMVYVDSNKTAGTFCILSVYPSAPSTGSPEKDLASEWDELIVKPFKADSNP